MKICIITGPTLPIPAIRGGAVQRIWQGLAEEFTKYSHDVTIYTRAFVSQPPTEKINGVKYIRQGGFDQSNNIYIDLIKDYFYAKRLLKSIQPTDILIINDFWLPALLKKNHDFGLTIINAGRYPKHQYGLYSNISAVISVSNAIRRVIVKQTPQMESKTHVIPNPVNEGFCRSRIDHKKGGVRTILYVGRIHPEKGIDLLILAFTEVFKQVKNIKLVIVGPWEASEGGGGTEYLEQLQSHIQKKVPIEFTGPIFDLKILATVYSRADIFCYPSLAEKGEAFGVAPLEAMAAGLVPIVSGLECFQDFITPNVNGYIFDHRSQNKKENLVKIINLVLSNTNIKEIKDNAIATALKFSYKKIANQYLEFFKH